MASLGSRLGDFIGIGALIPAAFERAGERAIGPALLIAAPSLTAVLVSILGARWLARREPRTGMVALQLVGAAGLLLPVFDDGLVLLVAAALVFGAVRTSLSSLQAAYARTFPEHVTGAYYGSVGAASATLELLGYVGGAGLSLAVGLRPALLIDVATFLIAALVLTRLPAVRPDGEEPPRRLAGWRMMLGSPRLQPYTVALLGFALVANVPETLTAPAVAAQPFLLPVALAASSGGTAVGAFASGRLAVVRARHAGFPQLLLIAAGAATAALGGGAVVAGNLLYGLGLGWVAGVQARIVRTTPARTIAPLTAAILASLLLMEGIGTLAIGAVATQLGLVTAYAWAGVWIVLVVVAASVLRRRLDGTPTGQPDTALDAAGEPDEAVATGGVGSADALAAALTMHSPGDPPSRRTADAAEDDSGRD